MEAPDILKRARLKKTNAARNENPRDLLKLYDLLTTMRY